MTRLPGNFKSSYLVELILFTSYISAQATTSLRVYQYALTELKVMQGMNQQTVDEEVDDGEEDFYGLNTHLNITNGGSRVTLGADETVRLVRCP